MIHAAYTQFRDEDGKLVLRLSAEGHAGAATEGGDIVCAAVSALMQTLGNRAEGAALNGGSYFINSMKNPSDGRNSYSI